MFSRLPLFLPSPSSAFSCRHSVILGSATRACAGHLCPPWLPQKTCRRPALSTGFARLRVRSLECCVALGGPPHGCARRGRPVCCPAETRALTTCTRSGRELAGVSSGGSRSAIEQTYLWFPRPPRPWPSACPGCWGVAEQPHGSGGVAPERGASLPQNATHPRGHFGRGRRRRRRHGVSRSLTPWRQQVADALAGGAAANASLVAAPPVAGAFCARMPGRARCRGLVVRACALPALVARLAPGRGHVALPKSALHRGLRGMRGAKFRMSFNLVHVGPECVAYTARVCRRWVTHRPWSGAVPRRGPRTKIRPLPTALVQGVKGGGCGRCVAHFSQSRGVRPAGLGASVRDSSRAAQARRSFDRQPTWPTLPYTAATLEAHQPPDRQRRHPHKWQTATGTAATLVGAAAKNGSLCPTHRRQIGGSLFFPIAVAAVAARGPAPQPPAGARR